MSQYWLMKSEPNVYSIDDLARDKSSDWTGVRNYQARNFMRDDMKKGSQAFFYHSSADITGIAGVIEVVTESHPDPTQFDKKSEYFDPKASLDKPIWFLVTVKFVKKFKTVIPLEQLRKTKGLEKMVLLQKGSRLSIQPVANKEWDIICKLTS